jgi:hypothetical protein
VAQWQRPINTYESALSFEGGFSLFRTRFGLRSFVGHSTIKYYVEPDLRVRLGDANRQSGLLLPRSFLIVVFKRRRNQRDLRLSKIL